MCYLSDRKVKHAYHIMLLYFFLFQYIFIRLIQLTTFGG